MTMEQDRACRAYDRWVKLAVEDPDVSAELRAIQGDEQSIEDAFYRDLEFGTGGLRGIIGAGTNRMNVHTVAGASQGLADYVKGARADRSAVQDHPFPETFACAEASSAGARGDLPRIAISYDSRIKSERFARVAAEVFAANGIQVWIYPELMPTPCLSYAVRRLGCRAGVMVTASHNPAKYNGYKVYGPDGCQITSKAAGEILAEIVKTDPFADVKRIGFEEGLAAGQIHYIPEGLVTEFIDTVKGQSLLAEDEEADKEIRIVYTPLNGTGLKPVLRVLKESGYTNVTVVEEQRQPDGHFPTCPYPNPEIQEAMALGLEYAERVDADLLLATDPDCDRVGIAVRNSQGERVLLTGNETGILLLDYICSRRIASGNMPVNPVFVKTIVTTDMAERIAADYGVRTVNVLTGFKYIGEQIGLLEAAGRTEDYILGFEESYGYLSGAYVRDKDGVDGAFLICEMAAYCHARGVSLWGRLQELYRRYGYCKNTLYSYTYEGADGFQKMRDIMSRLRGGIGAFGGRKVVERTDYSQGIGGLPKSDVLRFLLEGNASVVIRPSGTEPKLKVYVSVSAGNEAAAGRETERLVHDVESYLA